ncbi:MAG: NAD(P)H-dependent oxidoreductase, partial [Rhodoglobus sp.]
TLMIVVGSVRPGRAGLPVAEWTRALVEADGRFEVDFVDLAELALPFMDEPAHPAKREYTRQHTLDWSARVDAADAFLFIAPEYNHSYSPALKNAVDYLYAEWQRKPLGFVSYGGASAGTRGVAALDPVIATVGLVKTGTTVDINYIGTLVHDGVFQPEEKHPVVFARMLAELHELATALAPLR